MKICLFKRVTCLMLAVAMLCSMMPMTALASESEETASNLWSGRSAVFVGDSITAGSGTTKIYYQYLNESLGFGSVTAMGVGGSCISATSDYGQGNQPLINRYQNIPAADLIVIFMGTNDYGHETPLGSVSDTQDGTFYGALNVIVPTLVATHPSSKIVFVTPLHRYGFGTSKILGTQFTYDHIPNGVGATLGDYVDALKEVCANNGVSVIDLHTECTLDPSDAEVREAFMPDGIHPNAAGHEVIAGIMESHIRSYTPSEKVPVAQTEMIYGNKFATGYTQTCRASSRVNQYLKAGTIITLKDPATFQWACAKTSDENSSNNLGYFPDSQWTDKETAVVESDGWVGFTFKYRDETQSFDLSKPLSDYISIEVPHDHTYETVITAPTCIDQGYTTYTCECGDSYVDDYVDATGHAYENGICNWCADWNICWEVGTIAAANGANNVNTTRIRTVDHLRLSDFAGVCVNVGYQLTWLAYDADKNYIGNGTSSFTGYWQPSGQSIATADIRDLYADAVYFRLALKNVSGSNMTLEDAESSGVTFIPFGQALPEPEYELEYENSMNIGSWQDGAIWNGKLFVLGAAGTGAVYDLENLSKLATFSQNSWDVLKPHANSVCFGSTYYTPGDEYPLLYVNIYNNYASDEDRKEGTCCVYRISETDSGFTTELVQVIRIGFVEDLSLWKSKENNGDVRPYGNFLVDTDDNKLYAYVMRDAAKTTRFFKFDLPELTDGIYSETYGCNVVTLESADIEGQFDTEYFNYLQGGTYSSGMILSAEGFNSGGSAEPAIRIVDLQTGTVSATYYMANSGLTTEPEVVSIDPATGLLYYAPADGILRILSIPDVHFHGYTSYITAPTCTEQGYTTYTCECGESFADNYVEATGEHIWTSWQQIAEVNCQGQGRWMRSCETCAAAQYTQDQEGSCVSFNSPAILANSGDTVVLTYYDVAFDADTVADAATISWSSDQLAVDQGCVTPTDPGVYTLIATSGTVSKTIYLVVKTPEDTEYVLYFDEFTDATLPGYRPVEVPNGAQYYVSDGKLILDASNSASSYIRLLLPEWIGDFGDYEIRTTFTMTEALDSTKWFAVMARIQDEDYPYLQAPVRFNATAANGIELDQKNENNDWVILHKTSYTEAISPSKYYTQTFELSGTTGYHAINGTTLLESDLMAYGPGDVGFQVRGAVASIDSIRIVIPVDTAAHSLGDWTVTTPPTCTEPGTDTRSCSVCGYTETREVDPCHNLMQHTEKMHTCTESGWLAYETCTRCDYSTLVEVAPTGHSYHRQIHSIAHRGYSQTAPENTLAAYKLAKDKGYFYVECDVAFTADGIPVLLHDDTIDRTSDGTGKISELTYEQLLQYDFGSWKSTSYAGTQIPTFEEFIALCVELDLHPYIELKKCGSYTQAKVQQLVDIVEAYGMTDKVSWISYSNTFLGYVKNANPTARLGYIYSGDATESVLNTAKKLRTGQNEVFLCLNYSKITNTGVLHAATNGFAIEVWTVNSKSAILALPAYVSGVISDGYHAQNIIDSNFSAITAPICTEQGYTTYTCECGESYVDDYVEAVEHSYESGKCTVCGAIASYQLVNGFDEVSSIQPGDSRLADSFNSVMPLIYEDLTLFEGAVITGINLFVTGTVVDNDGTNKNDPAIDEDEEYAFDILILDASTVKAGGNYTIKKKFTFTVPGSEIKKNDWNTFDISNLGIFVAEGETLGFGHDTSSLEVFYLNRCVSTKLRYFGHKTTTGDKTLSLRTSFNLLVGVEGYKLSDFCDHSYTGANTAPTCTEQGYTTYTCTICGDTYVDDYTDATGHSWTDGACSICGATKKPYQRLTYFTVDVQAGDGKIYSDNAVLYLPDNYTPNGEPVKLVIYCKQGGSTITASSNPIESVGFYNYLISLGYAVLGVDGVPDDWRDELVLDETRVVGNPLAVQGTETAYRYVVDNYNISEDGCFISGYSQGGHYAQNVVDLTDIPILATAEQSPVCSIRYHQWDLNSKKTIGGVSYSKPARLNVARIYGFPVFATNAELLALEYDTALVATYDPWVRNAQNVYTGFVQKSNLWYLPEGTDLDDIPMTKTIKCPVKIWCAEDDAAISADVMKVFVKAIQNAGGTAEISVAPSGGHGFFQKQAAVGTFMENGKTYNTLPVAVEIAQWFEQYGGYACEHCSSNCVCIKCGEIIHVYTASITAPTCTEQGYTTYTCECGESYVDDFVEATGHTYENGICTACGDTFAGKTVSILSHSASTYAGVSNNTADNSTIGNNDIYYTEGRHGVYRKDTWWQQAADALGMELLVNNSWSGSCVFMPRKGEASIGYGDRAVNLHNDHTGEEPDIIWVYLGCNDFAYYKDSFGKAADVDYSALIQDNGDGTFAYAEPQTTCEAYAIMLHKVQNRYPNAQIYCMTSTARRETDYTGDSYPDAGQPTEYSAQLRQVAAYFGYPVIDLENAIPKEAEVFDQYMGDKRAHPNALGMDQITNEVLSIMLGAEAEIRHVTSENGVVNEQAVLLGGSYSTKVDVPEGYSVTVIMDGNDITEDAYADGNITIEKVTGDIEIDITRPAQNFRWKLKDGELVSTGKTANEATKLAGTVTDGVLDGARYQLDSAVVLQHDLPWVVEWKCAGDWRGVIFSSDPPQLAAGRTYISRTKGGQLCIGTWNGEQYNNYGVDLSGLDSGTHIYRMENRIAADGSNMIWLYVDDAQMDPMNNYFIGSNNQNATSDWVSGQDFVFPYIGSDSTTLNSCALDYLAVWENGQPALTGKTISILGDSISTYAGISNNSSYNSTIGKNAVYYNTGALGGYEHTWWQQAIDALGMKLLVNNAWSGSCILHTRSNTVGAYIDRCVQLHNDHTSEEPDVIAVFMGTNDFSYYQSTLGTADIDYETLITDNGDGTFAYAEPATSCEAYAVMLHKMTQRYPDAQIYCMGLTARRDPDKEDNYADVGQPTAFNAELARIVEHFGCTFVDLENCGIDKEAEIFDMYMGDARVHPNAAGMDLITQALISAMLGETATIYSVSAELTNVELTGGYTALAEGSYEASLAEINGFDGLKVTVTMSGEDITESCYANGKINIHAVTGDVTITASALERTAKNFRWEFDGTDLVAVSAGINEKNALTKLAGTTTDCVLSNTVYKMETDVLLRHDRPWVVEFEVSGNWSGMILSAKQAADAAGNTYLFKTTSNSGFIGFGERIGSQYHNYGIALGPEGVDTTRKHTYRLENRIAADGTNMVYLLVDGVDYGAMNHYFIGGTSDQGKTAAWLSGKDLMFSYIGASGHAMNNCSIDYLQVWENGQQSLAGKTISILGASISTFEGTSNGAAADTSNSTIRNNAKYYPHSVVTDVTLNDTWWMQTAEDLDLHLLVNNSWSGSSLLHERNGTKGAYVDRCVQLHDDTGDNAGEMPDIIGIQMGTNDFQYYKDTLGTADIDYAALIKGNEDGTFTYAEPTTSLEAAAIVLHKISVRYPDAEVYYLNISQRVDGTDELIQSFNAELKQVVEHFDAHIVDIYGSAITMDSFDTYIGDGRVHPNCLGMDVYTEAFKTALLANTGYAVETHKVSFKLDDVTANYGTDKTVVSGDAFQVKLTAADELSVTVTMGGEDITASAYSEGTVAIDVVTADVTITAMSIRTPKTYRWAFDGTDLISTGSTANQLTKKTGTTTDGVFSKTCYELEKAVVLQHDLPWVVEWKCEGTFKNSGSSTGARIFTSTDANAEYGARYIFKSNTNGLVAMGEKTTSGSHNYGIALGNHSIDWTELHTYRLENRIANDGSNMVWLYVDGTEIGPMNNYYVGTTDKKTTSDWISGKDFLFPYMGTDTHGFTNAAIEYIAVWEDGKDPTPISLRYDDHMDITGKTVEMIDAGKPTSYQVGYGVEENTVSDSAVVTLDSENLIATGIGTAMVRIDGVNYEVKVDAAPISLLLLIGQSNMEGNEGEAKQSIVCPDGMVYATYGDRYDMVLENATHYAPSALTGEYRTVNAAGGTDGLSDYPVYMLTDEGDGRKGPDSGFAYEWVKQTGEKVWIVNASHGGTSLNVWQPGTTQYEECQAMFGACAETLRKEIAAGHFTLSHMAYFWCQGCNDYDKTAQWYVENYLKMHDALKTELAFDHDSDSDTDNKTFEFGGIIPVRAGHEWRTYYREGVYTDTTDKSYYESFKDLQMSGPRTAQYWMGNNPELTEIWNVCTIGEDWVWMPDGTNGVSAYFQSHYPDGTVDYETQVKQAQSWYTPTTPAAVHDSIHYNQIGYNEVGREAVRNALIYMGVNPDYTEETTVRFVDWTGYRQVDEINASATAYSGTLVVPIVSPITRCKDVTYSLTQGLHYDWYDLTAESVDTTGTLEAVGADGSITVVKQKPGAYFADHLNAVPEELCKGVNLWNLLSHDSQYYTVSGWGTHGSGKVYSVTIPVKPGDQIYATSFGANGTNGNTISNGNGIRCTFLGEYSVIKSLSSDETYKEFSENGYLTIPEGTIAVNVPMWSNSDENELYVLNLPHSGDRICDICGKDTHEHSWSDWQTTLVPSSKAPGQEQRSCSGCDVSESREVPGVWQTLELGTYLLELPENVCCGMDLWKILEHNELYFHSGTKWAKHESGKIWSVTIPVAGGDRVYATSFGKYGENGNTVSKADGIRVTFFDAYGVSKTTDPAQTYTEFTENGGYLVAPEGAVAVNIPMWNSSEDNELYILTAVHDYQSVVTLPTCTEKGYTTHTCICGDSFVDSYEDAGHGDAEHHAAVDATYEAAGNIEYWTCPDCGKLYKDEALTQETTEVEVIRPKLERELFDLAGANLYMGGCLDMFFYIKKSDLANSTDYYVLIERTRENGTVEATRLEYTDWEDYDETLVRVKLSGIAAKEMTDPISVQVFNTDGTPVSNVWNDSVAIYAMRTAKKTSIPTSRTFLIDMLNYGAAAQKKFEYRNNEAEYANAEVREYQQYATQTPVWSDKRVKGANYQGTSCVHESGLTLTLYFKDITADMHAEISYTDHSNKEVSYTIPGSEFYFRSETLIGVDINTLLAADGETLVTCKVYDANNNLVAEATDSVASYDYRMQDNHELYTTNIRYTMSAYAYLHRNDKK